jgi:two-component system, LuxR family, sensor kinase FixL
MPLVLIVDEDPVALETIRHQLDIHGHDAVVAPSAHSASDIIDSQGKIFSGLITNVLLDGGVSGWDIARRMREINASIAVGYISSSGHRDWAVHGVPGSIMISSAGSDHDIPEDFFRLLNSERRDDRILGTGMTSGRRLTEAIERERDALQEHFQRTPSFIAFLEGPDHRYAFANKSYTRLVEREVVGLTVVEAFPEAVAQGYVDILDRVYRSGEDFVAHGVEFRIQLSATETKTTYIDLIYRPLRGIDGRVHGIFVEGEDLTAQLASQERIAALQNELIHVARINAMGMLASTLAHELNQPLASTQNFVSAAAMLAKQHSLDPVQCLDNASESALRAGEIIRRLRAMTLRRSVQREAVALEPALREAVATACTGRFDVQVAYDFQSTDIVRADPVQLQQVMLNLIRNALEAAGSDRSHLTVSTIDEGGFVRSCVRDSGSGIATDLLPRVFDAFATTKTDGMGVGLSLCKTIIESHGGKIDAHNNADGGATFCFTLPKMAPA